MCSCCGSVNSIFTPFLSYYICIYNWTNDTLVMIPGKLLYHCLIYMSSRESEFLLIVRKLVIRNITLTHSQSVSFCQLKSHSFYSTGTSCLNIPFWPCQLSSNMSIEYFVLLHDRKITVSQSVVLSMHYCPSLYSNKVRWMS